MNIPKTTNLLYFLIIVILSSCTQKKNIKYEWHNSDYGGGGYVTGIIQHPVNPDIIYIRTDVAGMFRSDDGGKSWKSINNGMSEGYHHNVETFAISTKNPEVLFRGSGEARGHKMVSAVHKSSDGGKTWKLVTDKPDFFGNGDTRFYGEKIAISPYYPDIVIAVSNSRGIWLSTDEGKTWNCQGLEGEPFGCVAFDPVDKNRAYAGTLDSLPFASYLYPNDEYKREKIGKLYVSEDKGKNWNLIFRKKGVSFTNIIFSQTEKNTLLATFRHDGIYKSTDGGLTFTKKTKALKNVDFSTISCDPQKPEIIYAAICRYPGQDIPVMPLYKSTDKGESWTVIKENYQWKEFIGYPSHYDRPETLGWAISKFLADNRNPEKFYLSDWFGLSVSNDGCKTWEGNHFKGLENICLESIVVDPVNSSVVYFTGADGQPSISLDRGQSYTSFPYLPSPENYYCSTAICPSIFKKGLCVYGVTNSSQRLSAICRTEDFGKHCAISVHLKKGLFVQAVKEDIFNKGVFYAYIDGSLKDSAGLYKSADWGKTWTRIFIPFPPEVITLPSRKEFIEGELLAVTAYQAKNVCGTNQLLCIDPFKPGTIYFGEADKGIFATYDNGKTWKNVGIGLPFGKNVAGILNVIKANPKKPGWLYAGFIHEGLWLSRDYGNTWSKIFPAGDGVFNATAVAAGGKSGNELYVASEPLFWSKSESAVYASFDYGRAWTNIYDKSLGSVRWKGIDVDITTGILHLVSCGNGTFYAKPAN